MNVESFENERWKKPLMKLEEHHLIARSMVNDNCSVLDIGCGDGTFLNSLKQNYTFGVDVSENSVQKCKRRGIKAICKNVETENLPFQKLFDYVCLLDVLEHSLEPVDLLKKASEYGEVVIISVPNMAFVKDRLYALFGLVPPELQAKKGHCYYMTKTVLENVCERAGLVVIRRNYYFPLRLDCLLGWFPSLFSTMFVYQVVKK